MDMNIAVIEKITNNYGVRAARASSIRLLIWPSATFRDLILADCNLESPFLGGRMPRTAGWPGQLEMKLAVNHHIIQYVKSKRNYCMDRIY